MSFSLGFLFQWLAVGLVGIFFLFYFFCQVCYIFVTGPLKRSQCSLLKCKLIKLNSSSLKLNHFKADWLPRLSLLLHFSFSLLAHPHFRKTICHSCEIATICISDAGVRVQTVAVLMSPMQSEMGVEKLISLPHYSLPFSPSSPLPPLLDTKCHAMASLWHLWGSRQVKDRFALWKPSSKVASQNSCFVESLTCLFLAALALFNQWKRTFLTATKCLH